MSEPSLEVVERTPKREVALPADATPALPADANTALLQIIANAARDPKVDVAKMQALFAMHTQAKAQQAAELFAAAMAEFKKNPPQIVKDKDVAFDTSKGRTEYSHATLGHVCEQIIAGLAAVGISHRWDLEQIDGGAVRVTCVLTHAAGHSVGTPLQSGRENSGTKNDIQALGSTITYLQRYTLLAATGLAAGIRDDDGAGAGEAFEALTAEEVANVRALLDETAADEAALLRIFKADSVPHIARAAYKTVIKMLEARRR